MNAFANADTRAKGQLGMKARNQTIAELIALNQDWFDNRLVENRVDLGLTPQPYTRKPSQADRIAELEAEIARYQQAELSAMVG